VAPEVRLPPLTASRYPHHAAFHLPAEDTAVCEARHRVRAILHGWGVTCGDDMVLVVSELFTNAVRHSGSDQIDVALWTTDALVYVEVTDRGPLVGELSPRQADPDDEGGRGLMLVEALAVRWGAGSANPDGGGHAVWAALTC
jgi:anti-sigma regulatory factor (Ser/Thr protein kinase)